MSQEAAVEIRGLTKRIGNKTIVDNLTFQIPKGEVFGLLGPNGAGKTTTIRMIVGLISITEGEVLVNGLNISKNFTVAMQHVGAIVENPELYKFLTGYQNLEHFSNMSRDVTKERIEEVIKQVGLEQRIHDKVKTYSLGMRQRLGLAQALLRKPTVLILDEPTNGLDPAGIRELRDYLRNLAENEGLAVIVSSHLLSEMELMCDRVAFIKAGKLIDVRLLKDTVDQHAKQIVSIEVSDTKKAMEILSEQFMEVTGTASDGFLELHVTREQVPDVVHALDANGIRIYAVSTVNKTLEETFLEITGGESHV